MMEWAEGIVFCADMMHSKDIGARHGAKKGSIGSEHSKAKKSRASASVNFLVNFFVRCHCMLGTVDEQV